MILFMNIVFIQCLPLHGEMMQFDEHMFTRSHLEAKTKQDMNSKQFFEAD